jgi:AraC-like DNA-binding protein
MSLTFFAAALNLSIELAENYDLDVNAILIEVGIDPSIISENNARIPADQAFEFFQRISDKISKPNVALEAGKFWHPTQMGALGYAWMTSSTLRSAFERLVRYARSVLGFVNITIEESETDLSLIFDFHNESYAPAFRLDGNRSIILAMIQHNAGSDFHPQSVSFSHPEPEDTSAFYALFQCPVIFNADVDSLTISLEDADKPRACSNKQLAQLHDQLLIEYVAKLDKNNIVERVKLAIINELGTGHFSDKTIAESLLISQRTLQRRLEEHNTTFKILVNEVRQDLADTYLNDSSLSLTEISFMLGFSEMSSFSRAFKRWSGQSPSHYRIAR